MQQEGEEDSSPSSMSPKMMPLKFACGTNLELKAKFALQIL